ncbi:MAG TPA: alpha/beta hydrolase [Marmoricola sp.]|nr:alpha/beta hydrolase [Marmoricola sp.]
MIEHRIGVSRRAQAIHTWSRVAVRPVLKYYPLGGPTAGMRPLLELGCAAIPRLGGTAHQSVAGRTWRGELVTPLDGPTSEGAVLYLHGGGFMMGGCATHRRIVGRLALETGMAVLSVDYRLLPQGRLHDSISDCEDAFRWLLGHGHPASKVAIVGDSAGGHLAFAVALKIRDDRLGTPAGIVAMSPWLDFDHMTKVRHHNARRDAYIPSRRLRAVGRMVVGARPELHHSPVNADLRGLPPSLIICGEGEVLRVDAELMADRLAEAGVPSTLQIWEGQIHAFPVLADLTPESRAAVGEVARFVAQAVAAPAYTGRDSAVPDNVSRIGVA